MAATDGERIHDTGQLELKWRADEARILRVSVNSFLDHLTLVLETMEMFGPPAAQ